MRKVNTLSVGPIAKMRRHLFEVAPDSVLIYQDPMIGRLENEARQLLAANGMGAPPEPLATDVGVAILKAGGNAFDAAAAMQFALAVLITAPYTATACATR